MQIRIVITQAMTANPKASLPHVAACISMGRLALLSENKIKVRQGTNLEMPEVVLIV